MVYSGASFVRRKVCPKFHAWGNHKSSITQLCVDKQLFVKLKDGLLTDPLKALRRNFALVLEDLDLGLFAEIRAFKQI